MFKTLQNAFKIPETRKRILFTFLMLVVVRLGSQLPVPGTDSDYFAGLLAQAGDAFNFFSAITGGSFEDFSIFALSITPYITSSIIMQLLTIAIPKLEELQKEGTEGRKKIASITRYVTVALALIQSIALSIGFGNQGLLDNYNAWSVIVVVITLTAGSAFLMWVGECITEYGIGNGISIVLLINILSGLPSSAAVLYESFVASASNNALKVIIILVIIAVVVAITAFIVLLDLGVRKIPVQYSQKIQGRRSVGSNTSFIPVRVNTGGVIPVIFASSLMSTPVVIAQFLNVDYSKWYGHVLLALSSSNWCRPSTPVYSIGLIVYIALVILFAYFYTSITFNPVEIANNMKKQGGSIPGHRAGKPTADYLNRVLNYLVFIGSVGLIIVCIIPIFISGWFNVGSLSFSGTSLIIIASVIMETIRQLESMMRVRNYKGFLNS